MRVNNNVDAVGIYIDGGYSFVVVADSEIVWLFSEG